jgi:hypothetical protein
MLEIGVEMKRAMFEQKRWRLVPGKGPEVKRRLERLDDLKEPEGLQHFAARFDEDEAQIAGDAMNAVIIIKMRNGDVEVVPYDDASEAQRDFDRSQEVWVDHEPDGWQQAILIEGPFQPPSWFREKIKATEDEVKTWDLS